MTRTLFGLALTACPVSSDELELLDHLAAQAGTALSEAGPPPG